MSDEQRKDEIEVEGHLTKYSANDEPADGDDESEVDAHIKFPNVRMDSPRDI